MGQAQIEMPTQKQSGSLFNKNRARTMAQRWELDTTVAHETFVITPYKPIYLLPLRWSSNPNGTPQSGNTDPSYQIPDGEGLDLNSIEAKFQISFKVKILQGIFWGHGDLWGAYTQKSHWQLYNKSESRPFRETNYEPEAILNFPVNFNLFGMKTNMLGVSFNHQSNGRDKPLSRSWNRIIFQAGLVRGDWSVYIRPWIRLPDTEDDNPDIVEYIGHGDVTVIYSYGKHVLSFVGSSNCSFNEHFKGYAELSWSYAVSGNLKTYIQMTQGYGETLIDYNNQQFTFGIGISLVEWL
jgi:phospholipase A1